MRTSDIASVVTKFGLAKKDVLCEQALDLFVNNYGSEAGNLALKTLCYGGLYIAGGIAPKILPAMMDNTLFYANLVAKGRMKSLLSSIPIYIVVHPQVGLLGAQVMALRLLEQEGQKVNELPSCEKESDSAASFGPSSPIIRGVSANAVAAMSEPLLGATAAASAAPSVGACAKIVFVFFKRAILIDFIFSIFFTAARKGPACEECTNRAAAKRCVECQVRGLKWQSMSWLMCASR